MIDDVFGNVGFCEFGFGLIGGCEFGFDDFFVFLWDFIKVLCVDLVMI